MRICLIGCGSIAQAAHGPALKRLQQEGMIELAACCDLDESCGNAFRTTFQFAHAYTDYEQMLRAERPDAVFALLPVRLNAACAVRVLRLGYPVILEKPPGINRREAESIMDMAERQGLYHAVLFNRRSMPLARRLKELLRDETIDAVSLEMCREGRGAEDFTTTAVHGVDCARFLVGKEYEDLSFAYQENAGSQSINYYVYGRFSGGVQVDMRFLPCAGAVTERITVYTRGKQFYLHLPVWSGTTYVPGFDTPGCLVGAAGEGEILRITGEEACGSREAGQWYERIELFGGNQTVIMECPDRLTVVKPDHEEVYNSTPLHKGWANYVECIGFAGCDRHFIDCVKPLTSAEDAFKTHLLMNQILATAGLPDLTQDWGRSV